MTAGAAAGEPIRILLIDDDEDQFVLTRSLLADIDGGRFRVDWEPHPEAALAAILTARHDLYLLDYQLGAEDGLGLLRKAVEAGAARPIVMLTGQGGREIDVAAMEAGAADYLTKESLEPRGLERSIRYALERAKTLAALRRSEERYALAARGAQDGLWDWDLTTGVLFYSARWKEILGLAETEIGDRTADWFERVHPDDLPELMAAIDDHLAGRVEHFESEHRLLHRDGSFRWILARGLAVRDERGRAERMAGSSTDITDRKVHDALTGLPNRALFLDRVAGALARLERRPDDHFALLYLDLDRFKLVNDSLGHGVGDHLLVEVADRLRSCVRPSDTVARLGGDEFAVLLDDAGDATEASHVAERICQRIAEPFEIDGREIFTLASLGIATSETGYCSPESVLRDADAAMYRAKSRGDGSFELFDEEMRALALARLQLESDLRRALDRGQVGVAYQPIFSVIDGRMAGIEALMRWHHPERGEVPPTEFIPVAEEIGLITPLWRWLLERACRDAAEWRRADGDLPDLHVNLSPRQLGRPEIADDVEAILSASGFPAGRLQLEITESSLVDSPDEAEFLVDRLRAIGVRFALDDFGKGYSSMAHLSRFQLHSLKIDRSFVGTVGRTEKEVEITRAIVGLAHSLGMIAVAEGVEQEEQLERLRAIACDQVQGFLVARPTDAATIAELVRDAV